MKVSGLTGSDFSLLQVSPLLLLYTIDNIAIIVNSFET